MVVLAFLAIVDAVPLVGTAHWRDCARPFTRIANARPRLGMRFEHTAML